MVNDEFEKWWIKQKVSEFEGVNAQHVYYAWQAATESMQAKLDEKDKELEALRGFLFELNKLQTVDRTFNDKAVSLAVKFCLFDENGNPTKLLTGEK